MTTNQTIVWRSATKRPVKIEYREPSKVEIIHTKEGELYAFPGVDYIIRGVEGEQYPIKKDIFEKTYDTIDERVVELERTAGEQYDMGQALKLDCRKCGECCMSLILHCEASPMATEEEVRDQMRWIGLHGPANLISTARTKKGFNVKFSLPCRELTVEKLCGIQKKGKPIHCQLDRCSRPDRVQRYVNHPKAKTEEGRV